LRQRAGTRLRRSSIPEISVLTIADLGVLPRRRGQLTAGGSGDHPIFRLSCPEYMIVLEIELALERRHSCPKIRTVLSPAWTHRTG